MRDRLTKEDEDNIDLILNPYPIVTEDTLDELDTTTDVETRNNLVGDLSIVLSNYAAVLNPRIQSHFPRLINLLKDKQIYNSSAIMLSDACRHIDTVQNSFTDLGIFELLSFNEEHYNTTVSLVYSLCMDNPTNTEYFLTRYHDEERDGNNRLIQEIKNHK